MHDARLCRERGERSRRGGARKIEHAVDIGEEGERVVGDGDAEPLKPGNFAEIAADRGRAFDLEPGGDGGARRLVERADERLAHAPGGAKHADLHVTHGRTVWRVRVTRRRDKKPPGKRTF